MLIEIYAIRDTASEGFARPFFFQSEAMAVRSFCAAMTGGDEAMASNPDDFTLYRIGSYNDESGIIEGHDPVRVITGFEAVAEGRKRIRRLDELNQEIEKLNGEGGYAQ